VTLFFELKVRFLTKRQDESEPIFFQGLGENTCSLQPALKSNAPGPNLGRSVRLSFCQLSDGRSFTMQAVPLRHLLALIFLENLRQYFVFNSYALAMCCESTSPSKHVFPVHPETQAQLKSSPVSVQVAPFSHGFGSQ